LVDYASDVDSAVDMLCRGSEFAEAYRLVSTIIMILGTGDKAGRESSD
jgi:hypothetical protein